MQCITVESISYVNPKQYKPKETMLRTIVMKPLKTKNKEKSLKVVGNHSLPTEEKHSNDIRFRIRNHGGQKVLNIFQVLK